jgi:site-specific recombinase XerD
MYQDTISQFIGENGEFSLRTQEIYSYLIQRYAAWLDEQELDMRSTTSATARAWLDSLAWGNSLRHLSSCALRAFARWAFGPDHPLTRFRIRRENSGPQRVLDLDQVERLFDALAGETLVELRDRALLAVALDTGLRATELCELKMDHLYLQKQKLAARVKGGAWQSKTMTRETIELLEAWLAIRGELAAPGVKNVFVSIGGNTPGKPLTRHGLRANFQRLGKRAGLRAFSPHDCRRTMATQAIKSGAPTRVVQIQGGWSDLAQLVKYTEGLEAEEFQPYSPMASIGRRRRRREQSNK